MSIPPIFQRDPKFNAVQNNWPKNLTIDVSDHAESVRLQFLEKTKQPREIPFYGLIFGTIMPFLCALFSTGTSQLRLEGAPQAELIVKTTLSREEVEKIKDKDHVVFDNPLENVDDQLTPPVRKTMEHEVQNLTSNMGKKWEVESSRSERAALKQVSRPPDSQTSVTSTASVAQNIPLRIIRIADGLFCARARTSAFKVASKAKGASMPAVSVEVKVPHNRASLKVEITEAEAREEIKKATPQVVQHAQFIFHLWPDLTMIWTMTTCGRYALFKRFIKDTTPDIVFAKITEGQYYEGQEVPTKSQEIVRIMDTRGKYTKKFKELWDEIMGEVEKEYVKMMAKKSKKN